MQARMRIIGGWLGLIALVSTALVSAAHGADRPNILWISCEDMSANLGCYGDSQAITPNLDQLAEQGMRFTRAFTPAGVCAVVRSGVITGMYPPAIGSQHMRSHIVPPPEVKAFPELLREAGYFCTNRSKTDYQFPVTPSIWDRQGDEHGDWRDRDDPDQPFFSVINLTLTHESQIRHDEAQHQQVIEKIGRENRHDPAAVGDSLPPYLPDTQAARLNWAWYHDNVTLMDKMAGEILDRLEQDGLADSTLVVFWSDHGMGMPRGKRWLYDSGTHVPLIMRWPGELDAGAVREDLVSVLDLPPTMLAAAGVRVPRVMHGRVVLGADAGEEPPYLFFHRDRMDEVFELQRASRDRRWKYIRNYEPEKPYSQHLEYMDKMPAMQDWRRLAAEDQLSGAQKHWFAATKPIEELYDTEKDPWELNNLAALPQYSDRLERMREATERWQEQIDDTGLIPEAVLMEEMLPEGKIPQTEPPEFEAWNDEIRLRSATEGASIVYRLRDGDEWSDWKLYVKSLPAPEVAVEAMACRLGFRNSPSVRHEADEAKAD